MNDIRRRLRILLENASRIEIGETVKVTICDKSVEAKVDSGAEISSIHATGIKVIGSELNATILGNTMTFEDYSKRNIKNPNGEEERYVVELNLELKGKSFKEDFTLTNREHMEYEVIIGKNVLKDNFSIVI